jgi:hypothetical protein
MQDERVGADLLQPLALRREPVIAARGRALVTET